MKQKSRHPLCQLWVLRKKITILDSWVRTDTRKKPGTGYVNIYVISRWCQNYMNIVPANVFRISPFFYFDVIFHNCRTFINKSIHMISSPIGSQRVPNRAEINELILYSSWCCDLWYSKELELKFLLLGCKQWHWADIISKNWILIKVAKVCLL